MRDHRRHVADAAAVLERVAKSSATVLGWSSGGNIVLALTVARLTVARPDLVSGAAPQDERDRLLAHAGNVLAKLDPRPYGVMFEHLPLSRVGGVQVPVTCPIGENSNPLVHRPHR